MEVIWVIEPQLLKIVVSLAMIQHNENNDFSLQARARGDFSS